MKDNSQEQVEVTYYSRCHGYNRAQTNKCDWLHVGDVVSFDTEILVTSCPDNVKHWNQTFKIYPVGHDEALTVDLELICAC